MNADSLAAPLVRPLWRDRALVLAGIAMSAFNLRTAVTSLTPLLDTLGDTFGFGPTMTGVLGMVPTAAFAVFGVVTPAIAHRLGLNLQGGFAQKPVKAYNVVADFPGSETNGEMVIPAV